MAWTPAGAQTAPQGPAASLIATLRADLDALKRELDQIEQGIAAQGVDQRRIALLRERLQPVVTRLQRMITEVGPRVEALRSRVEQLAPKRTEEGKEPPPESPDIVREREMLNNTFKEADEILKFSNALLVQATQVQNAISDKRRELFAAATFERSASILSPDFWVRVARALPTVGNSIAMTYGSWLTGLKARGLGLHLVFVAIAAAAALVLMFPARRLASRLVRRTVARHAGSRFALALGAVAVAVAGTAAPIAGAAILDEALRFNDIFPLRLDQVDTAFLFGTAFLLSARAVVHAALAPERPEMRLIEAPDVTARRVLALVTRIGIVIVATRTAEAVVHAVASPIEVVVAIRAIAAAFVATFILRVLLSSLPQPSRELIDEGFGPFVAPPPSSPLVVVRLVSWAVTGVLVIALLTGFIALASFVVNQTIWIACVLLGSGILIALADAAAEQVRRKDTPLANFARFQVGLTQRRLEQISILGAGAAKILVAVFAATLLLAPWGVDSTDVLGSIRGALIGFQIGGLTISISGIVTGIAILFIGLAVVRTAKRWLSESFLPTTQLDSGLRNSIGTVFGYAGYVLVGGITVSALGLSLDRLTIVAGALSVGIGFGLQSIVNNFVSGLILLWERPIRVGDWVVVGEEQGIVRRINVRSTEIETFDRTSVIVPNSNLISGVVKNRVLSDRLGRISILVGVTYAADPDEVRRVLFECAAAHEEVLEDPSPIVSFKDFGASSLDFELLCFVADIGQGARISSEMRFIVFKRLSEAGIEIPYPQQDMHLRGAEGLSKSLEQIASLLSQRVENGAQAPATPPSEAAGDKAAPAKTPAGKTPTAKTPTAKTPAAKTPAGKSATGKTATGKTARPRKGQADA